MSTATILVIEDNPTARKMIRVTLEAEGFAVLESEDGRGALEHMSRTTPDLIVQDLVLPDFDGIELTRALRQAPGGRDVPIVVLSGFLGGVEEAAAREGISAFLTKPVAPSVIVETVRKYLPVLQAVQERIGSGRRVLVVDDNPSQLKLLKLVLGNMGFEVTTAADGAGALREAARRPPDAIVSDVLMPELDGFDLSASVRSHPRLRSIPVVLVSSHLNEESDRELARRSGANRLVLRTPDLREATDALIESLSEPVVPAAAVVPVWCDPSGGGRVRRILQELDKQTETNAALSRRLDVRGAQSSLLQTIFDTMSTGDSSAQLAEVLADALSSAGIPRGALFLAEGERLILKHSFGYPRQMRDDLDAFFSCRSKLDEAMQANGPVAMSGWADARAATLLERAGASSAFLVPLVWNEERIGVLFLASRSLDLASPQSSDLAGQIGLEFSRALALSLSIRRLAQSEMRCRQIVENVHDGVWAVDAEGCTTIVNPRMAEILGHPRASLFGKGVSDFCAVADQAAARRALERDRALSTDVSELSLSRRDGTIVLVRVSHCPLLDADGLYGGALALVSDLTELKRTHAQVMTADRMSSVSTLAAGIAHELNNPLTAVLGNLELALSSIDVDADAGPQRPRTGLRKALSDAQAAAVQVRGIVHDLKAFSRSDDEVRTLVDVGSVLESSARIARHEVRRRARFSFDLSPVPPVLANASRLGQVFLNLMVNAAQAIPAGDPASHEIRVSVRTDDLGRVVAEIRDTGCGMTPAVMAKLFTPFFTTKPPGEGTGLGLSICHRIVSSLNGEITVDSAVGKGTTFRVHLRAAPKG